MGGTGRYVAPVGSGRRPPATRRVAPRRVIGRSAARRRAFSHRGRRCPHVCFPRTATHGRAVVEIGRAAVFARGNGGVSRTVVRRRVVGTRCEQARLFVGDG